MKIDRWRSVRPAWGRPIGGTPTRGCVAFLGLLACLAGAGPVGAAATSLEITAVEAGPAEVVVEFRDGAGRAERYRLEHAPSLAPGGVWATLEGAIITGVRTGEYRGTAPRPPGEIGFLRVAGILPGGGEVVSAAFQPGTLVTREGDGAGPRLVFSRPTTGRLRYTYSGPGISETGEVHLAEAVEVTLPAPRFEDNERLDDLRLVSLRLEPDAGSGLDLVRDASVVTEDNDEVWHGMFGAAGEVGFSLVILRTGASERAMLRGDASSFFPPGDHPAATWEFSPRRMRARIPGMALMLRQPPFQGEVVGELELEADAPEGASAWPGQDLLGRYLWRTRVPGRPYLNFEERGEFHLKRQPAVAPSAGAPLRVIQP